MKLAPTLSVLVILGVCCSLPNGGGNRAGGETLARAGQAWIAGRYEEALPLARKAIEANGDDPLAHGVAGGALLGLGYLSEAEKELRLAERLETKDRHFPGLQLFLAMTLEERARPLEPQSERKTALLEETLQRLEKDAQGPTPSNEALEIRGKALAGLGRTAEAVEIFLGLCASESLSAGPAALAPLFALYVEDATPQEAFEQLEKCGAHELDLWCVTTDAYSSLYAQGLHGLARKLAVYELARRGKSEIIEAFSASGEGCSAQWMRLYLDGSPKANEVYWVGGLYLASDCEPDAGLVAHAVTPPVLVRSIPPEIPDLNRSAAHETTVLVFAVVDAVGTIVKTTTVPSPANSRAFGREALSGPAIDAVRKWQYQPAMKGGKPIEVPLLIVVRFDLI